jgi:hypothetical protein
MARSVRQRISELAHHTRKLCAVNHKWCDVQTVFNCSTCAAIYQRHLQGDVAGPWQTAGAFDEQ